MFRWFFTLAFALTVALAMPGQTLIACPMCSEAVPASSGLGEEDQAQLSRAYNNSIYLMVGVPYLALGTVGFMVYRHLRVRAANESISLRAAGLPRIETEPEPR